MSFSCRAKQTGRFGGAGSYVYVLSTGQSTLARLKGIVVGGVKEMFAAFIHFDLKVCFERLCDSIIENVLCFILLHFFKYLKHRLWFI